VGQQQAPQQPQVVVGQGSAPAKVPLITIAAMTCTMAAMSGLGALPYFFVGSLAQTWSGVANAVACGVMVVSCAFGRQLAPLKGRAWAQQLQQGRRPWG
jgi:hypothetical protein